MLSYIIPTRDRAEDLARTLSAIGMIDHTQAFDYFGGVEVIVVDNASRHVPIVPTKLRGGIPVRALFRASNEGAAARNVAASSASGRSGNPRHWLVMLDDDSAPLDGGHFEAIASAPEDVAAIGAEVFIPSKGTGVARESGGLPEVFIGCGAAIRRSVFLEMGGYDASFGYYAEEYDLCARLLLGGWRVTWDRRFRVMHQKVERGRDMNTIVRHLVRNNVCVAQRYAPEAVAFDEIDATIERYLKIAQKEHAIAGFDAGLLDLQAMISSQPRREMPMGLWERFTGLSAASVHLEREARQGVDRVAFHEPPSAKGAGLVRRAAQHAGIEIVEPGRGERAVLIGTLSPGPMLDAAARVEADGARAVQAWSLAATTAPMALLEAA